MERRIAKITLYQPLDEGKIQDWIDDGDTLLVDVERTFTLGNTPVSLTAAFPDGFSASLTGDIMLSLRDVLNAATWVHAAGSYFFKITEGTRSFVFTGSYVWDNTDITETSAIPAGTVVLAEFTTPGLPDSVKTLVSLPYGQALSTADLDALTEVDLTLSSGATGSNFTITGKTPFTVRFLQPADATVNYVFDFSKQNTVILP